MKLDMLLDDLRYRIKNLRFAISDLEGEETDHGGWEAGYRKGRLSQMESEVRFLKDFYTQLEQKQ